MSRNNTEFYDKSHSVQVYNNHNEFMEEKSVNIMIKNNFSGLQIKLRDTNSFLFNYTANIDINSFQHIQKEQCLEISFEELGTHLLEMLSLHHSKNMLLKCELSSNDQTCKLIFYEKSKIKSLIFLLIEMKTTNQHEMFEEMDNNMKMYKDTNKNLQKQLFLVNEKLNNKIFELQQSDSKLKNMKLKFEEDLDHISDLCITKIKDCEQVINKRLIVISIKIVKLLHDLELVKSESSLKCASSNRLLQNMENLRMEGIEHISAVNQLRTELVKYEKRNGELDREVTGLQQTVKEKSDKINDMQCRLDEYRKDLENSAMVIAQKSVVYDELRKDMEQANQVIRNYNKHYDAKAAEVDEIKETMASRDTFLRDQIFKNKELFKEYQEYKLKYNVEQYNELNGEVSELKNQIQALEKDKRELIKLNGLLTRKLSTTNLFSQGRI